MVVVVVVMMEKIVVVVEEVVVMVICERRGDSLNSQLYHTIWFCIVRARSEEMLKCKKKEKKQSD